MRFTDRLIIFLVAENKDKSARALAKVALHEEELEELVPVGGSDCHGMVVHPTQEKVIAGDTALVTMIELPYAHDEELVDAYHVIIDLVGDCCSVCMVNCAASIANSGDKLTYVEHGRWQPAGWSEDLFEYHSFIEVK